MHLSELDDLGEIGLVMLINLRDRQRHGAAADSLEQFRHALSLCIGTASGSPPNERVRNASSRLAADADGHDGRLARGSHRPLRCVRERRGQSGIFRRRQFHACAGQLQTGRQAALDADFGRENRVLIDALMQLGRIPPVLFGPAR